MSFLDDALVSYFEAARSIYPQRSNWPSQLGLECSRQILWNRTRWAEKALPDVGLQRRFELGKMLEPAIVRLLGSAGIQVEQTQRPLVDEELQLSGKIDGLVRDPAGQLWVPDFKTTSGNGFRAIVRAKTAEGLLQSEKAYLRGYPLQVGFYARMLKLTTGGLLFCVNKESLETATIEVRVDDPAVVAAMAVKREQLLAVNAAIKAGVDLPPEPGDHCRECPFLTQCMPDLSFGGGLDVGDDPELEAKIERHEELKPLAKEYGALDEDLKKAFTEPGERVIGEWLVVAKPSSTTVFDVPKEIKAQYARRSSFVRRSYVRRPGAGPVTEAISIPEPPRFVALDVPAPVPVPPPAIAPPAPRASRGFDI